MLDSKIYVSIFVIIFGSAIPLVESYETTIVKISIEGESVIDLSSVNRMVRAYVDVFDFDPSEGVYSMHVVQLSSGEVVSEKEIFVRETENGQAGTTVAYMVDENTLSKTGAVEGTYEIWVKSESGESISSTNFEIRNSLNGKQNSVNNENQEIQIEQSEVSPVQLNEKIDFEDSDTKDSSNLGVVKSETSGEKNQIPEWIRNIFVLYSNNKISDIELINALQFLIDQKIIEI